MFHYLYGKLQNDICYNCRWVQLSQWSYISSTEHDITTFNVTVTKFCWQLHSAAKTLVRFHWFFCSYCRASLALDQTQSTLHNPALRSMIMSIVWRVFDFVKWAINMLWRTDVKKNVAHATRVWEKKKTFDLHHFYWHLTWNNLFFTQVNK